MKGIIYTFSLISGILFGLTGLFMFIGIQGARGIGDLLLGIPIILLLLSCSVGGFGAFSFKNWARRLLVVDSVLILLLLCGSTSWNILNDNAWDWDAVGYIMDFIGCVILLCNLFVFTRPGVKEQFK